MEVSAVIEKLCTTPHEVEIAFIILFAALIAVAIGKGGGKLLLDLLKKLIGHESVNINLAGGEMARIPKECESCGLVVDPSKCVMHQSEHERSLRNEEEIKNLWTQFGNMRKEMNDGFKETRITIIDGQSAILKALGKRPVDWEDDTDRTHKGGGGGFGRKKDA